jgi:EamA domain-containing membrane protein RarD
MLQRIKDHLSKGYNFIFWLLFAPAMAFTLWGVIDLYMNHFDELTKQDHLQFFLRIFFPISVATYVAVLERRQRLQKEDLIRRGNDYLRRNRSAK